MRKGLHILKGYTERHVKSIKNSFYRNACLAWFKLVTFEPNDQRSVESLWIYDNILLKDDDGRVYKPPDHFGINRVRRDMPNIFKDLPFPIINRTAGDASLIRSINSAYNRIVWKGREAFTIKINNENKDVDTLTFKQIYWSHFEERITPLPWKVKWERIIGRNDIDWEKVWWNVHEKMLTNQVQSSYWQMINLNYISAFRLNKMYNTVNSCKLCNKVEEGPAHVFIFCEVSNLVFLDFETILNRICNIAINIEEKAFGILLQNDLTQNRERLRNFFMACIKHILFKRRATVFLGNNRDKCSKLVDMINKFISKDLESKFINAKRNNRLDKYESKFLIENIIGRIDYNEMKLILNL